MFRTPLVAAAVALSERMGKTPITVTDSPGFASSRLGLVIGLEAMRMFESGVASAADIDTAIHNLRSAKMARLTGGTVTRTQYTSGSVEKQFASLADIDGEIARLEAVRSRLTGQSSRNGPIRIGFGGRV